MYFLVILKKINSEAVSCYHLILNPQITLNSLSVM